MMNDTGGKLSRADEKGLLPPEGAPEAQNGAPRGLKLKKERQSTIFNKRLFLEYFTKTLCSITATCEKVHITRETFYDWQRNDPQFVEGIKIAMQRELDIVEDRLKKAVLSDNVRAITYMLDRRHPKYKPKAVIEQAPIGETAAEDDVDDFFEMNDTGGHATEKRQPRVHTGALPDPRQARKAGAVPREPRAALLLGKKNPKKHHPQSAAEGDQ
jgi:hypothetical protein